MTTTIQDLRTILFDLENQDMTVRQLRDLLFAVDNQDEVIKRGTLGDIEREAAMKESNKEARLR